MFMTCAISYLFSGHSGIYISQKISKSKSKLIEVPQDATLSYYRTKRKEKLAKSNNILLGQFQFGCSSIELPSLEGMNMYKITSKGKGVRLVHHSYNPDGHTWSASPQKGQFNSKLKVHETEIHAITIAQSYGKKDKLFLINTNLFRHVEIDYYLVEQHQHEENLNVNDVSYEDPKKSSIIDNIELQKVVLGNQFKPGRCSVELPNPKGQNIYRITVKGGKVRLCHNSYNPDGHTWTTPPGNGQKQHVDIEDSKPHIFEITIGESYGKSNKISLVNCSLWETSKIKYTVERLLQEDEDFGNLNIKLGV